MAGADHLKFMKRCLELASKAEGLTYPNPLVGSVIVNNGRIIGEGYHVKAGSRHAEVLAIESVKDRELLFSSTLYVNLEPCSHYGKTPPCADRIITEGIPVIVSGATDTSTKVSGKGFARLREAGCRVITNIASEECRFINRRFLTFHEKRRPYIVLKWAQSADGFIGRDKERRMTEGPLWITGNSERILVHKWRVTEQAILVGGETVRADNPKLNVREWTGNSPIRLILSGSGNLPSNLAMNDLIGPQVVFTFFPDKVNMPRSVVVKLNKNEPSAIQVLDYLYKWGIQSLLIEGGSTVLNHFMSLGLWDEARVFQGYQVLGSGVKAPGLMGRLISQQVFSNSRLYIFIREERRR
ncbi:MAG TPA: bifunctional diaminohydroxyphosphoribosylaminopyrimidine deaminase/5-amino-6-(5-phosphoribosylamino)uracil reductase RibD [Bacteroidales bacterium]|nr:bifunctional diaminohydroxyphosphoribosylaminopyrimidine deaminase/5-amino-6-(5-phosphoribosylamino)uracil reductase RibD [Bacteroidales bacterium]